MFHSTKRPWLSRIQGTVIVALALGLLLGTSAGANRSVVFAGELTDGDMVSGDAGDAGDVTLLTGTNDCVNVAVNDDDCGVEYNVADDEIPDVYEALIP